MAAGGPPLWLILACLVIVQVGFSGYSIVLQAFAKNAGADSLVFSMFRDAFCAPVLFVAAVIIERGVHMPRLVEIPFFALLGLFGMFGNQYGFIQGLFYSGPDIASIFQPLIPVFTALLAFLLCMEKLPGAGRHYQWFKLLGIALGAGGAILMTVVRSSSSASEVNLSMFGSGNCSSPAANKTTYALSDCVALADTPFELYYAPPTPGVYAQFKCNSNDSNALVSVCSTSACDDCGDFATLAPADTCVALGQNTPGSFDVQCVASDEAKNKVLGIIFLVINCGSMAVYVLLQKRFVFDKSPERKLDPLDLGRWTAYPITVTSYSYFFGAMFMAATAGIRYAINGDSSVFVIPKATFGGLAYAVFVSSALCYGLITWCNKYVSAIVVTSFWPLQVFVTVILAYLVFGDKLVALEYVGMVLILFGMGSVTFGNHREQKALKSTEDERKLLLND